MLNQAEALALEKARAGDEARFAELVAPYRGELRAHCYRMAASVSDAEDMLQDALLRAWRGLSKFEGRSSLRTWLYRVTTNACIDALAKRRQRTLPSELVGPGDPAAPPAAPVNEPLWVEPCPALYWQNVAAGPEARYSARESVAIAFLVALQTLPPLQRAVLILRDVLGFSASDVAELLETSVAAANSALQRARTTIQSQKDETPAVDPRDPPVASLVARYVQAWEGGDMSALVSLLRDDAILTMPPVPTWFSGREAIVRFLSAIVATAGDHRLLPTEACAAPALAAYIRAPGDSLFRAHSLQVLRLRRGEIAVIDVFMDPALLPRFGLATVLS